MRDVNCCSNESKGMRIAESLLLINGRGGRCLPFASANQFLRLLSEQMSILRTESKGRIFFVHQEFQDILHYIYIEASFQAYSDGFFCGAFSDYRLPYDVITRISEMLEEKEVHNIWQLLAEKTQKIHLSLGNMESQTW